MHVVNPFSKLVINVLIITNSQKNTSTFVTMKQNYILKFLRLSSSQNLIYVCMTKINARYMYFTHETRIKPCISPTGWCDNFHCIVLVLI